MTHPSRETAAALPLPQFNDERDPAADAPHVAVSTLDYSGKVSDRSALRHLGWCYGQDIALVIAEGVVKITEKRGGGHAITAHGYLRLPAEIRTCARINRHDRILLIAIRESQALLIYPPLQAAAALRSFTPSVWQQR
ncbi:hypothetical protein AB0M34_11525 [Nocardia sp. NPDC050193]